MTTSGRIPFALRSAVQLVLALALMAAPFAAGAAPAATALCLVIGALAVGLALASTVDERGLTALPLSAIRSLDRGLALGAVGAALVLALDGHRPGAALLLAFGLSQLLLHAATRWSLRA